MKWTALLTTILVGIGASAFAVDNKLTKEEKKEGWILLFNGKNLKGWETNRGTKSTVPAEDGMIRARRFGGYLLVHKKLWSDFILSLDYKLSPGGNSGVFIRQFPLKPPRGMDIPSCGIEVQVHDVTEPDLGPDPDNSSPDFYVAGALYDLSKVTKRTAKPAGEWNHMVITADDNIITVNLNGEDINRMDLDQFTEPGKRPDGTSHKFEKVAWAEHAREGYIGFQDHGDDVWYKNIKILPLNTD